MLLHLLAASLGYLNPIFNLLGFRWIRLQSKHVIYFEIQKWVLLKFYRKYYPPVKSLLKLEASSFTYMCTSLPHPPSQIIYLLPFRWQVISLAAILSKKFLCSCVACYYDMQFSLWHAQGIELLTILHYLYEFVHFFLLCVHKQKCC